MGRPRISVDFAIVLRTRDELNRGWSRMAEEYRKLTGEYVSRDTMKRRYLEARQKMGSSGEGSNEVYLELDDIKLMEREANTGRDKLLIRLLSRLGCRVSELLALRVRDIDFEQGKLTILHRMRSISVSCPDCRSKLGSRYQYCPVCGRRLNETTIHQQERRRMRVSPIDQRSIDMLKEYLIHNGSYVDSNSLLFDISRHRAWQIVRECARRAGLPRLINPETGRTRGISPHRLRDAFSVHAMKLNDSGDGLRLLQEHLGHASFNTTARYRKIAGAKHREWYNNLWNDCD